jgi:DNA repair protein RadC
MESKISKISLRLVKEEIKSCEYTVNSNTSAVKFLKEFLELDQLPYEIFGILCRSGDKVTHCSITAQGTIDSCYIPVQEILKVALLSNASDIILFHNHPSGSKEPSSADISLTKKVIAACKLFDMNVLDHIIITSDGDEYSMKEHNTMPTISLNEVLR